MEILFYNTQWMFINLWLAGVALVFGKIALNERHKFFKPLFLIVWLLFVPNTLYILTDYQHLPEQWPQVESLEKIILFFQYLIFEILGFLTFILSVYCFERMLTISRWGGSKIFINSTLVALNFLIGFGIVLGRIKRLNSWEIVTDVEKVTSNTLHVALSSELMLTAIFFGLIGNISYFLFREKVILRPSKRPR
ncbi:MAG: DUF1361 domain-containing protein [bacterium]|nr:DUF1361 domain-containing protein [bacterium]